MRKSMATQPSFEYMTHQKIMVAHTVPPDCLVELTIVCGQSFVCMCARTIVDIKLEPRHFEKIKKAVLSC